MTTHCQSRLSENPLARQLLQETWEVHIQQIGIQKQETLYYLLANAGLEGYFHTLLHMGIVNPQLLAYITDAQIERLCAWSPPQRDSIVHLKNQMMHLVQHQRRDILRAARTT